jgi:methionine--tRNA ligase beta chain
MTDERPTDIEAASADPEGGESPDPDAQPPVPDLRAARVLDARDHPNADRLMIMDIDLGEETRQIVAGIVGHYEPGDLVGQGIVVVANLEPAKLRGEVSEGMLLAAENEDGELGLLLAPEAPPGTPIRTPDQQAPSTRITFDQFHENDLVAHPDAVTMNGKVLGGALMTMDRDVFGKLR